MSRISPLPLRIPSFPNHHHLLFRLLLWPPGGLLTFTLAPFSIFSPKTARGNLLKWKCDDVLLRTLHFLPSHSDFTSWRCPESGLDYLSDLTFCHLPGWCPLFSHPGLYYCLQSASHDPVAEPRLLPLAGGLSSHVCVTHLFVLGLCSDVCSLEKSLSISVAHIAVYFQCAVHIPYKYRDMVTIFVFCVVLFLLSLIAVIVFLMSYLRYFILYVCHVTCEKRYFYFFLSNMDALSLPRLEPSIQCWTEVAKAVIHVVGSLI